MAVMSRQRNVVACKVEGTPGSPETLAQADAEFNAFNCNIQPGITLEAREAQASLGQITQIPGASMGTATLRTELYGGSSLPKWATTLLLAAGFQETAGVFTPDSRPPGVASSEARTVTLAKYVRGTTSIQRRLHGAMVRRMAMTFITGQIVMIDWELLGIYTATSDQTMLVKTEIAALPLTFRSSALAIASFNPKVQQMTLTLENELHLREDPTTATGYLHAYITGRRFMVGINPEADQVAAFAPETDWLTPTTRALAWTLGTSGNRVAFAAPKFQYVNVQEGERNRTQTYEIEGELLVDDEEAGDDEIAITVD